MKKLFISSLILALSWGTSCTNLIPEETEVFSKLSIEEAQMWYDKYAATISNRNRPSQENLQRNPIWDFAEIELGNQKNVWVPLTYNRNLRPVITILQGKDETQKKEDFLYIREAILIQKNLRGEKEARLIQVTSTYEEMIKKNKPNPKSYTGWVLESTLSGILLKGNEYKNGKLIHGFDAETTKSARTSGGCYTYNVKVQTVSVISCGDNCTDVTVTLSNVAQTFCDNGGGGTNTDPEIAVRYSGGSGSSENLDIYDIRVRLNTPCLSHAFNLVNSVSNGNQLSRFLEKTFNRGGGSTSLWVTENPNIAYAAKSILSSREPLIIKMELNPNLATGSQERVVSTFLHEILHAKLINDNYTGTEGNSQQHQAMLTDYIQWHKDALQEIFNISDKEAYALIFGGYFDVYRNSPNFYAVLVGSKGLTLSEVDQIYQKHVNKLPGTTPCD